MLSSKNSTGYHRVSYHPRSAGARKYEAKRPDGSTIGCYYTAVDAAVAYARAVSEATRAEAPVEEPEVMEVEEVTTVEDLDEFPDAGVGGGEEAGRSVDANFGEDEAPLTAHCHLQMLV